MFTNGLPVLYYCDFKFLLKIRQISKAMRKRVVYILKDRKLLVVRDPKGRAKNISKWILKLSKSGLFFNPIYPFKSIEYDRFSKTFSFTAELLNEQSEDVPANQLFKKTCKIGELDDSFPSLYFDRIDSIDFSKEFVKVMPKHTFKLVDKLCLPDKECPGIKEALQRIRRVGKLKIEYFFHDLNGIDWINKLKILRIENADITTKLELPSLNELFINSSAGLYNLTCPKLEFLEITEIESDYNPKGIANFTELKVLRIDRYFFGGNEHLLPRKLRHFYIMRSHFSNEVIIESIVKQCPGLFSLKCYENIFDIASFEGANLRQICSYFLSDSLKGKSTIRLKKTEINSYLNTYVNQHPEIISKATYLYINSNCFDWKHLPDNCKKFKFGSMRIFGENSIDKHIEKLRGSDILSITVETACEARRILRTAANVRKIFCEEEVEELRKEFAGSGCEFKKISSSWRKRRMLL